MIFPPALKREIISKRKVFHFVNGGESEWLKGMEEKEKRKEKNCWLLDPLKIPHSLHFLCLPAPSRWLFEFALALLSVINAVLTF